MKTSKKPDLGIIIAVTEKKKPMNDLPVDEPLNENTIALDASAYPDSKDGDEVETTVRGKLSVDEDGNKSLTVTEADGKPVGGAVEEETGAGEEPSTEDLESKITDYAKNMKGYK